MSLTRTIRRGIYPTKRKLRTPELTPAQVAVGTGLDLYHARLALHGLDPSRMLMQRAVIREARKVLRGGVA